MKTTHPYELLVRWDQSGAMAGAHVIWREVFTEGDEVVAERLSEAQTVAVGEATGFPIATILDRALIDALSALDAAREIVAASDTLIAQLRADLAVRVSGGGSSGSPPAV